LAGLADKFPDCGEMAFPRKVIRRFSAASAETRIFSAIVGLEAA
jgi:hypothetical protein